MKLIKVLQLNQFYGSNETNVSVNFIFQLCLTACNVKQNTKFLTINSSLKPSAMFIQIIDPKIGSRIPFSISCKYYSINIYVFEFFSLVSLPTAGNLSTFQDIQKLCFCSIFQESKRRNKFHIHKMHLETFKRFLLFSEA